jgi:hypothetical protein
MNTHQPTSPIIGIIATVAAFTLGIGVGLTIPAFLPQPIENHEGEK